MFVAAFPLAPLIALITNLVEIRIDAINMIKTYRRPVAYKSQGIGVWYDIMITLTTVSVEEISQILPQILSEFKRINFYSLWNHQKTVGFLMISGEIQVN